MKRITIILITIIILAASFSACQTKKEVSGNNTAVTMVTEAAQEDKAPTVTASPSATPVATSAPTLTPEEDTVETNDTNTPYVMDTPPFKYYRSDNVTQKDIKPLTLTMRFSETNEITDEADWLSDNQLTSNSFQVPNINEGLPGNLPPAVTTSWEDLIITNAFYDSSYLYCVYGSNISEGYKLRIYDAKTFETKYRFDFSSYRYAPDYVEEDYDFIQQKINWASIRDNILYISHSHLTYAKSSKNQNSYITAIDLSDMSILWRSDALVSNAYNFLIIDDVIVCGYGFTDEADYLYQLNRYTGEILDKTPLASMASYIIEKDHAIYVRTYDTNYIFDVTP